MNLSLETLGVEDAWKKSRAGKDTGKTKRTGSRRATRRTGTTDHQRFQDSGGMSLYDEKPPERKSYLQRGVQDQEEKARKVTQTLPFHQRSETLNDWETKIPIDRHSEDVS